MHLNFNSFFKRLFIPAFGKTLFLKTPFFLMVSQKKELVAKGKNCLEDADFEKALEHFDEAIGIDGNDPDLWNLKGITLRSMGRYTEATDCFERSLKLDPRDKQAS